MSADRAAKGIAGNSSIFKFRLEHLAEEVQMPVGAQILHVHDQDGGPCIWALVDPDAKKEVRRFFIVGTGHKFDPRWQYIGTAHCGGLVWHVFEEVHRV